MTNRKKWLIVMIFPATILLILLVIGGKIYMDQKAFHKEMVEIVKSDEAKQVFEEGMRKIDPKALSSEGVIKSYEIDYDSIEHNPMGGIMVNLIVNDNYNLYLNYTLDKNSNTGELEESGGGISAELSNKLGR